MLQNSEWLKKKSIITDRRTSKVVHPIEVISIVLQFNVRRIRININSWKVCNKTKIYATACERTSRKTCDQPNKWRQCTTTLDAIYTEKKWKIQHQMHKFSVKLSKTHSRIVRQQFTPFRQSLLTNRIDRTLDGTQRATMANKAVQSKKH